MRYLNEQAMQAFAAEQFRDRRPFPWFSFEAFLLTEAFQALLASFPPRALFEEHRGIERANQQRPHDRYYLAFERSIYRDEVSREPIARDDMSRPSSVVAPETEDGVVSLADLPLPWQAFLEELRTSAVYRTFIDRMLESGPLTVRFAWHMGFTGSEVSPHRDSEKKAGTHIFYFNTSEDWAREWGGSILVLGEKRVKRKNPDVSDFGSVEAVDIRDNRSFLFKNTEDAWHGVEPLHSPDGQFRRLFNVIFERQDAPQPSAGSPRRAAGGGWLRWFRAG